MPSRAFHLPKRTTTSRLLVLMTNTLTVSNHNLQTGDVIEYKASDGTTLIGGLEETYTDDQGDTETRQYTVIWVDEEHHRAGRSAQH